MKQGKLGLLLAGVGGVWAVPALAVEITLTAISTVFPNPIGIDHYEPTNRVVMSVNYPSGTPHALRTVAPDGSQAQFSTLAGVTDEVKIATVRPGNLGGFVTGDLFVGNGIDGQIVRVTGGGSTILNPWVDLPGAGNGLMRGSLYVDRTGVFGGDLIVATTAGEVWRINSLGVATKLADVNIHLEGLMTVPNDPTRYGPLAGRIIAGAETANRLYTIGADGSTAFFSLGVAVEDIDLVMPNENFFGVNFGTGRLLGAPAGQFSSIVGDILLTQEFPIGSGSGLYRLLWNGSSLVTEELTLSSNSFDPGQWEHVTFSRAGIVEIPPVTVPEPATILLTSLGLALLARRRKAKD